MQVPPSLGMLAPHSFSILCAQATDQSLYSRAVWYSETSPYNHVVSVKAPHNYTSQRHLLTSKLSTEIKTATLYNMAEYVLFAEHALRNYKSRQ